MTNLPVAITLSSRSNKCRDNKDHIAVGILHFAEVLMRFSLKSHPTLFFRNSPHWLMCGKQRVLSFVYDDKINCLLLFVQSIQS